MAIVDRTRLLASNTDVILQNCPLQEDVVEYDVVWFVNGEWTQVNGTSTALNTIDYNWGIAYHVDPVGNEGKVIYEGQLKGCDAINNVGKWYADAHGKLTTTPTHFYVGHSSNLNTIDLSVVLNTQP